MTVSLIRPAVALSVDIVKATYEMLECDDGDTVQSDALSTYTDTSTYAAHVAEAEAEGYDPMMPVAWIASVVLGAYCTEASSWPTVNAHDWFSAEPYSHPYTGQIEETSAHISGDYTDAMAREVAAIIASS